MKRAFISVLFFFISSLFVAAQPAFEAPPPSTVPVLDPVKRRAEYLARVKEVINWAADGGQAKTDDPAKLDLAMIAADLVGPNMLRDTPRLAGNDIDADDAIQQRRLAVVDMGDDGHIAL